MTDHSLRLPAEWEPQAAVLIAWPHAGTDWAERLAAVETTYVALAAAVTRFQPLIVVAADAALRAHVQAQLRGAGVDLSRVRFVELPYDDTWLRDSGPITLVDGGGGGFQLTDFRFTGWGGKFGAEQDDALVAGLAQAGVFGQAAHKRIDWALEGGGIESDGDGSILTTWRCLVQRHPEQSREEMSAILRGSLHADRVLWLDHGYLEGDDTDAHIDTLARFAPGDRIVFQACDDTADHHHDELQRMGEELAALRTTDGRPYRLHPLPWAQPILDEGRRLAASYANYLIVNGAVLVPAYGDSADAEAARIVGEAHPGRVVVQVPCRPLIWQNGSLHCITMQLPAGIA
ncbi:MULTISPECIES: agmatine deiminase family protein [Rhodanobacter]|uniref:agmatine deiminase family protein n=1 Tax=Rhodanobacter TaxID=75309 RepID=UPI00040052A5|nr:MULTISPECIES: agmatine deiminase family protein [Rhodanobacter]KZC20422.1 agmatine deiminase [Rhodanobacter denitrificans]UJJ52635.1 agmatine deiminase family protein [Rhodanobacter denitrificans]UJM95389.1 agmatine deiminase family protein [Rhodanobacter denitrificans]UJM98920.1 agmatine deiminase family protein [Rhodanobacter denitrificans]UJN21665.1 agmatine deiminase family protein [Rhodanobacter denitrificans]